MSIFRPTVGVGRPAGRPTGTIRANRDSPQFSGLLHWWTPSLGHTTQMRDLVRAYDMTQAGGTGNAVIGAEPYGGLYVASDGVTKRMATSLNSTLTGNPSFSLSALVYIPDPITTPSGSSVLAFFQWGGLPNYEAYFATTTNTPGQIFAGFVGNGFNGSNTSSVHATTNDWTWVTWTRTGGGDGTVGNAIYINGVSVALGTVGGGFDPDIGATPYYLFGDTAGETVNVRVADIRVYDRVLQPAEVFAIYAPETRWELYQSTSRALFVTGGVGPQGIVQGTGVASEETAGTHTLSQNLTQGTGLASDEVTGTHVLTFGLTQSVGVASEEALGSHSALLNIVQGTGVASVEAVGIHGINNYLRATGVSSDEAVGSHALTLSYYIGHLTGNLSGSLEGGTPVTIIGPGVDMSYLEDVDFTDATVWTQALAGDGRVSGQNFVTTRTQGSSAYVYSVAQSTRIDVTAQVRIDVQKLSGADVENAFFLGCRKSSTSYVRASIVSRRSGTTLEVVSTVNGREKERREVRMAGARVETLRILRVDSDVYTFLNDRLVAVSQWTAGQASVEMGVSNGSTGASALSARLVSYSRNPVIMFGDSPLLFVQAKTRNRLDGLSPASDVSGEVTVSITSWLGTYDLSETFTYDEVGTTTVGGGFSIL